MQIAKDFYNLPLGVKVLEKASSASGARSFVIVTFRLNYDNRPYVSVHLFNDECFRYNNNNQIYCHFITQWINLNLL